MVYVPRSRSVAPVVETLAANEFDPTQTIVTDVAAMALLGIYEPDRLSVLVAPDSFAEMAEANSTPGGTPLRQNYTAKRAEKAMFALAEVGDEQLPLDIRTFDYRIPGLASFRFGRNLQTAEKVKTSYGLVRVENPKKILNAKVIQLERGYKASTLRQQLEALQDLFDRRGEIALDLSAR